MAPNGDPGDIRFAHTRDDRFLYSFTGFQSYHKKRPIEEHAPPHFISFENGMIYKTSPYEQRFEWTRFCYKQNISDTETLQDDLRSPFMILPTSTTVSTVKPVLSSHSKRRQNRFLRPMIT